MIQKGTYLNIADNSGAKKVCCIHIYKPKTHVARIGDIILVSIKSLRSSKRSKSKIKKGEIHKAIIVRTKCFEFKNKFLKSSNLIAFLENSVILLDKKNKLIGSRILGPVSPKLKQTKYSRIISVSSILI